MYWEYQIEKKLQTEYIDVTKMKQLMWKEEEIKEKWNEYEQIAGMERRGEWRFLRANNSCYYRKTNETNLPSNIYYSIERTSITKLTSCAI